MLKTPNVSRYTIVPTVPKERVKINLDIRLDHLFLATVLITSKSLKLFEGPLSVHLHSLITTTAGRPTHRRSDGQRQRGTPHNGGPVALSRRGERGRRIDYNERSALGKRMRMYARVGRISSARYSASSF